jgi:CheY-like chemotaxis protein
MSPAAPFSPRDGLGHLSSVVVVDPRFNAYSALAESARQGKLSLHIRSSGSDAIKLGRRLHVDAWLVAAELDDMSGQDLVELLRADSSGAQVAMVMEDTDGRRHAIACGEATEVGADSISHPISLADLERLLGMPSEERARVFGRQGFSRSFVTLPVGVGAAMIAIAVLMMG